MAKSLGPDTATGTLRNAPMSPPPRRGTIPRATNAPWDRTRMLPRLIAVGPEELADLSREGRAAIVRRLLRALRGERVRGRAGHWSYSLDRHIGLVQALAAERASLAATPVDGRTMRA